MTLPELPPHRASGPVANTGPSSAQRGAFKALVSAFRQRSAFRARLVYSCVVALIALVGALYFLTGAAVRMPALYFFPLILAGWHLGTKGALVAAALTTWAWVTVMRANEPSFAKPQILALNAGLAALGFLTVALIMVRLVQATERERVLGRSGPLTGLANRRALTQIAAQQLAPYERQRRPVSLAYFDLDAFKSANDRLGHEWGDSLLRSFGRLMTRNVRVSDTAARLGGDEFVVFLPDTEQDFAQSLASRLRDLIDEDPDFRRSGVTVSAGVVSEAPAKSDLQTLLRLADAAMYQEKVRSKATAVH